MFIKNLFLKNIKPLRYMLLMILFSGLCFSCEENTKYKEDLNDPQLFNSAMKSLTDVIVYDIFSPPVASRVYMYPSIASYAVI